MRKYNEEKVYGEFLKWYYLDDMDYYDFYKKLGNDNYKISVVSFDEVLLDRDERNLPGYTTYEDFIDNYKNYMKISDNMIEDIKFDVVKLLMNLREQQDLRRSETAKITKAALASINSVDGGQSSIENPDVDRTVRREEPKVGRNDPCPCRSGKKYKNCCGKNA